jgi:AAA family ATP:ADP antiporter
VQRLLEFILPVRRGERRLTFMLFFHSMFAVGAFLTGRTVRDALFLAHGDRAWLPWMYVASAAAVTLSGLLYGRVAALVRRDVMAVSTSLGFAVAFGVAWFAERTQAFWAYAGIYVLVELMGALVLVQFWTLANELFNASEAKRLYAFIGAGGTLANIVLGLVAAGVAKAYGTPTLLLLCAGLLVVTAGTGFASGRVGRERLFARAAAGRPGTRRTGGGSLVLSDSHLRAVALLAVVTFFTTTLVDYQFKVVAADQLHGDALAAFFGYFTASVGALAMGLQLFGTSRLLNRVGVIGALAVLPVSLLLGNTALVLAGTLWAASLVKGADALFRYSVNDATTQILYLPVPATVRVAAKAFVDGVLKPAAIGLAGLFLAAYRSYGGGDPYLLAWVSLGLCALWVGTVMGMRAKYLRSLQENLKQRRLDLGSARYQVVDSSTRGVLERALRSADEQEVLGALNLLPQLEQLDLDALVEPLLEHPSAPLRIRALEHFARRRSLRHAGAAMARFEDPDPGVRAAAVDAFCAIGREKAVRSVKGFLTDPDPRIRAAAVTGMIRFGGLDGVLVAAEALKGLVADPQAPMRLEAARVLGAIGVKNFYQPVLQLMSDPDLAVRRAAIVAAGTLQGPELVLPLIYRSQARETMQESLQSLAAYGPGIIPTLAKALGNAAEDTSVRRSVARVLGRLGTPSAVEVIARHLDEPEEDLRALLYRALARAVKGRRLLLRDVSPVREALDRELRSAWRALHQAEVLGLPPGPTTETPRRGLEGARALLGSALTEKVQQVEGRVFLLLAVLHPSADMEQIAAGLGDAHAPDAARRRGNAVELLENLLERGLRQRFLPLLEDLPRGLRLRMVAEHYPPRPLGPSEALAELASDQAAWVRACASWCVAEAGGAGAGALLEPGVSDRSPVVREIALASLVALAPERARALARGRVDDESAPVRALARSLATLAGPAPA